MNIWVAKSMTVSCVRCRESNHAGKYLALHATTPVSSIFTKNRLAPKLKSVKIPLVFSSSMLTKTSTGNTTAFQYSKLLVFKSPAMQIHNFTEHCL